MNFCQTSLVISRKTIGNDDWNRISNGLNPILQKNTYSFSMKWYKIMMNANLHNEKPSFV